MRSIMKEKLRQKHTKDGRHTGTATGVTSISRTLTALKLSTTHIACLYRQRLMSTKWYTRMPNLRQLITPEIWSTTTAQAVGSISAMRQVNTNMNSGSGSSCRPEVTSLTSTACRRQKPSQRHAQLQVTQSTSTALIAISTSQMKPARTKSRRTAGSSKRLAMI